MVLERDSKPLNEQETVVDVVPVLVSWPPPPRDIPRRPAGPTGVTIVAMVLALVLVLGGLGFIVFSTTRQYNATLRTSATVLARSTAHGEATSAAATRQILQGTAQALSTAEANIQATATAEAGITATVAAGNDAATATTTALGDLLTQKTSGTAALDDTLTDNSGNHQWDVGTTNNDNTGCKFINGDYHALQAKLGFIQACFATSTSFSNFVYEVTMTIDKGGRGGILFRADKANSVYYLFHIGTDGTYTLDLYNTNNAHTTLTQGTSSAITTGIGQSNQLAVIADSGTLYLYANQQYLTTVNDTTLTSGQIGVVAINDHLPTEVEFSDAKVWTL